MRLGENGRSWLIGGWLVGFGWKGCNWQLAKSVHVMCTRETPGESVHT